MNNVIEYEIFFIFLHYYIQFKTNKHAKNILHKFFIFCFASLLLW